MLPKQLLKLFLFNRLSHEMVSGVFVFSGIILSSFQYNANSVLVEQIESNFPIVIRYDSIKDYIFRIQFPLMFKVCNMSNNSKQMGHISYYYKDIKYALSYEQGWNYNLLINKEKNGELLTPYRRGRIVIDSLSNENFVFHTGHSIRYEDSILQSVFRPFISQFKNTGKDTLHIGTIQEFKKNILKLLIYCFKMIAFNFGFILLGVKIMAIISFYLLSRNKM